MNKSNLLVGTLLVMILLGIFKDIIALIIVVIFLIKNTQSSD